MGEHRAPKPWVARIRRTLHYVRTHKAQLATLSVLAVGLVSRYVPSFPADEVLRVVGVLLGVA